MNDTFNFGRFSLLLKKTILERPMQLIGMTGLILCFTFILYAVTLYAVDYGPAQNVSFIWGFAGGGTLLASFVFSYFNTNAAGSAYLTLPASALEKWLCGVLIAGVFFCAVFMGFYRLIDYSFITAYHNGLDKTNPQYQKLYDHVYTFSFFGNNTVGKIFVMWFNFAGAMMVGSLYFNRVAIVKVALVVCGFLGALYSLNLALANMVFKNVDVAFPYYTVLLKVNSEVGVINLPEFASTITDLLIYYVLPASLWITAFIRLREKEI